MSSLTIGPRDPPLKNSLGLVLWLALETRQQENRFEEYIQILVASLRERRPKDILHELPFHLQQDMELATFNWQPRFTWDLPHVDEADMSRLYDQTVLKRAVKYFEWRKRSSGRNKSTVQLPPLTVDSSHTFVDNTERSKAQAFFRLLQGNRGLATLLGSFVGVPFHCCPKCVNALICTCSEALLCYHRERPRQFGEGATNKSHAGLGCHA